MRSNRRILIADDNREIHDDFQMILGGATEDAVDFDIFETQVIGESRKPGKQVFELDFSEQGQEALEKVQRAVREGRPYALAFMDLRMPPGWDGMEATSRILDEDPHIQIVICSAHSDCSWGDMAKAFGGTERVLILKKPFDVVEIQQLAYVLTKRWDLAQQAVLRIEDLERRLQLATASE